MHFTHHYATADGPGYIEAHEIEDVTRISAEFLEMTALSTFAAREADLVYLFCEPEPLVYRLVSHDHDGHWTAERVK